MKNEQIYGGWILVNPKLKSDTNKCEVEKIDDEFFRMDVTEFDGIYFVPDIQKCYKFGVMNKENDEFDITYRIPCTYDYNQMKLTDELGVENNLDIYKNGEVLKTTGIIDSYYMKIVPENPELIQHLEKEFALL